jgi:uncharacterized protein with PQ loop repeat
VDIRPMLGTLGTAIGLVRAVPQLVRLLRTREAHGVSVDTAATSSVVSLGWATYGVLTKQPYVTFVTSDASKEKNHFHGCDETLGKISRGIVNQRTLC